MLWSLAAALAVSACRSPAPVDPVAPVTQASSRRTPVPSLGPSAALAADAGQEDTSAPDSASPEEALGEGVLGWVAGQPLGVGELLAEWHTVAPKELWLVLEKVVAAHLARAEAQRIGLKLAPEDVHLRVEAEGQRLRTLMADRGTTLEEFARRERGMEAATLLHSIAEAVRRQMLVERVVRAWVLTNEWVRLRVIIVRSPREMRAVEARLAGGADFAELAKELSVDATAAAGGLLPFLVREEGSALARQAFRLEPGEQSRGFEHQGLQVLLRLEEKHAPLPRPRWSALSRVVETSLGAHPIGDTEFSHWKLTMEKRYPIDVEPLRAALGLSISE